MDELYNKLIEYVKTKEEGDNITISEIQRTLPCGYVMAISYLDNLVTDGIIDKIDNHYIKINKTKKNFVKNFPLLKPIYDKDNSLIILFGTKTIEKISVEYNILNTLLSKGEPCLVIKNTYSSTFEKLNKIYSDNYNLQDKDISEELYNHIKEFPLLDIFANNLFEEYLLDELEICFIKGIKFAFIEKFDLNNEKEFNLLTQMEKLATRYGALIFVRTSYDATGSTIIPKDLEKKFWHFKENTYTNGFYIEAMVNDKIKMTKPLVMTNLQRLTFENIDENI